MQKTSTAIDFLKEEHKRIEDVLFEIGEIESVVESNDTKNNMIQQAFNYIKICLEDGDIESALNELKKRKWNTREWVQGVFDRKCEGVIFLEVMKCQTCNKELTVKMEIEYSRNLGDYFCSPNCAMHYYFEYMQSTPFDVEDRKDELAKRRIKVINGKLYTEIW